MPTIRTYFDKPFPKNGKNITRDLGADIQIIKDGKTYSFHLEYYKADKTTLITDGYGDTVYNDQISRYRGVYYFHEEKSKNEYWIGAAYVKDSLITGFLDFYNQMQLIQDSMEVYSDIHSEEWPSYLSHLDGDSILLNTDKRNTHGLFKVVLEQSESFIFQSLKSGEPSEFEKPTVEKAPIEEIENDNLVLRFGPVPVKEKITILLKNADAEAVHSFHVYDLNGKEVYSNQVKGPLHDIETAKLGSGTFIFTVVSGEKSWSQQFVVAR